MEFFTVTELIKRQGEVQGYCKPFVKRDLLVEEYKDW